MSEILDFDPIALREKYRHERDRRLRPDGQRPVRRGRRRLSTLYRRSTRRARLHPQAANRRGRRGDRGGRLWRPLGRGAPARVRGQGYSHHRERRRLRRHLVLESISGCTVRHRKLHLPAAAGRDRLHSQGKIQFRRRDPCACASDWREVRSVSPGLLSDRDQRDPLAAG